MNTEVIEPVLQEMLEEIKQLTEEAKSGKKKSEDAIELLKNFDNKISDIKVNAPEVNLSSINKCIENGIFKITNAIEAQPKIIRREFHFHFFPKLNINEYYQTYSRLVFWLTLFLLAGGLVDIGVKWIEGYNQREENSHGYQQNIIRLNPVNELKKGKVKSVFNLNDSVHRKR